MTSPPIPPIFTMYTMPSTIDPCAPVMFKDVFICLINSGSTDSREQAMRDTCVTLASYRCRAASKPRLLNLNDVDMAAAHLGHALLSSSAHTDRVYSTLMLMPQGHALGRHKELVEWADVSISHVLEAIKDPQAGWNYYHRIYAHKGSYVTF